MNKSLTLSLLASSLACSVTSSREAHPCHMSKRAPMHSIVVTYGTYPSSPGFTYKDAYKVYCTPETAEKVMNGLVDFMVDAKGKKYNVAKYQTLEHVID